jgi:hypothetical protein
MGPTADGTHSVVFIMDSPTPQSGAVMIVETNRVHASDIPLTKAFGALSARGLGLGELVRLPKTVPSPVAKQREKVAEGRMRARAARRDDRHRTSGQKPSSPLSGTFSHRLRRREKGIRDPYSAASM